MLHLKTMIIWMNHADAPVGSEDDCDKLGCLADDSMNRPKLYTIGYEGRSKDEFIDSLRSSGIRNLVDVRELPWSRKAGFSRAPLCELLTANGIAYMHLKPLGSPRKLREGLRSNGDFNAFARAYSGYLAEQTETLDLLASSARLQPTVIMCFERDPSKCHRSMIASRLASSGFDIMDI